MSSRGIYQNAKFLKSAVSFEHLPPDTGHEVAFIGRSNAGKSSSLNTITGIKGLARVSKTPGRTQAINLFTLSNTQRLVDLPGYGYAKVPRPIQQHWEKTVQSYLENRKCLRGLILVMDIRHPLRDMDDALIHWAAECDVPVHVLLTKADKLTPHQARTTLQTVTKTLAERYAQTSVQLFSSFESMGLKEAMHVLDHWLKV